MINIIDFQSNLWLQLFDNNTNNSDNNNNNNNNNNNDNNNNNNNVYYKQLLSLIDKHEGNKMKKLRYKNHSIKAMKIFPLPNPISSAKMPFNPLTCRDSSHSTPPIW